MFGVVAWLEHGLAEWKNKNYKRVWKWVHTILKGNWCIVLNIQKRQMMHKNLETVLYYKL